ncbi:universal stress protein [Mycolicibacterium elephantis]|uniref:Universal stress protein n=1 Tax=Mycolicibacterium elephantis TaxID=81858 RepID=A0A0M2ZLH6_9MYCO|nr:universal stress protein [Mycolicibacterium elephantis]KKW64708.1 universal stress protein [Mycolicibacterium elephantis]OBB23944.1 universal stress protein [Mycolicibacterium elephantis]OBE91832.1 universal stress protein [Mycolicibacterium elephantis]ORA69122.1 universal stress protein [Mycolicibacterium elephantis]
MAESTTKYGILVAVDGSPESDAAVGWAAREAAMRGLPVTLMHVIAPVEVTWPVTYLQSSFDEWQEENAKHVLEQAQKTFQGSVGGAEVPAVNSVVEHGPIASTLVAASADAWMVVAGNRGMGALGRALLGSVSSGLLHYARGPVAIIPADEAPTPDPAAPVLLGIDGSPASEGATALAFDEASRRGVELVALHAWSDNRVFPIVGVDWQKYEEEGHKVLAERLAGWQEQYPDVRVRRRLVCDQPARWLLDESNQAQLVVVGSRGRGGFKGMLLGSVATKVAQGAKVPVIVVRDR